jgi:integrase
VAQKKYVSGQPENPDVDVFSASWLHSRYDDHVWIVSDSHDITRRETIDFHLRLPDGRDLVDAQEYYGTIKSYAFWARSDRFSNIDNAFTHMGTVRLLMHLAHRLCLDGIRTFSHLVPSDIEKIVEDVVFGVEGVVRSSARLDTFAEEVKSLSPIKKRDLADRIRTDNPSEPMRVSAAKILDICNLPDSIKTSTQVVFRANQIARLVGLKPTKSGADTPLPVVSKQAVHRFLLPLERLFEMRSKLGGGGLTYHPFPEGSNVLATAKGLDPQRTPLVAPFLMLDMLEKAVKYVADYIVSSRAGQDESMVVTACWIVIAAFTGRRKEEIAELEDDCVEGNSLSGWYVQFYINKTLQHRDAIPVPHLVVKAVEVLKVLSAETRKRFGRKEIFLKTSRDGQSAIGSFSPQSLDRFAKSQGVSLPVAAKGDEGEMWHWHPHQFRRFFATLYFYRFEGATLEVLSHHLRHFNIEMTRRYVTRDPEMAAIWLNTEWGYQGWIARQMVANGRSVTGSLANELQEAALERADFFRRKLTIVSPDSLASSLALIMRERDLVLTPKPWILCSSPMSKAAAAIAACQREAGQPADAVGPDFSYAGEEVCAGCPHGMKVDRSLKALGAKLEDVEAFKAFEPGAGTVIAALQESRAFNIRRIISITEAPAEIPL